MGQYAFWDYPKTLNTDESYAFKVTPTGDVSGLTWSFGYEFICDGVTTTKIVTTGLTTSSYTWTPTTAVFAPLMKKSQSGTIKYVVKTSDGQNEYKYEGVLNLKSTVKPAISSLSVARTDSFNNNSVSNITTHKLSFNVAGLYGASQTVTVTVGSNKYTKSVAAVSGTTATKVELELGSFDAGTSASVAKSIAISVVDSRGRTATGSTSITVYKYTPPDVTASIARNANEVPVLTYSATYQASVAGGTNTLKQFFARCIVGSATYPTDLKGKTSPQTLTGTYDIAKSYKFIVVIQDSIRPSAIIKKLVLPSDTPVMDIGADGHTVTFFGSSPNSATKETLRIGEVASFGEDVVIGDETSRHAVVNANGFTVYDGTTEIGKIGYGDGVNETGETVKKPYYTLGKRKESSLIGNYSTAEGEDTTASGVRSHAEGYKSTASGSFSHAEGISTKANEYCSHAEGSATTASGDCSHAEGSATTASGKHSHASGFGTIASSNEQFVIGRFNEEKGPQYAFIIGNGQYEGNTQLRKNAFTVDFNGDVHNTGLLESGALSVAGASTLTGAVTAKSTLSVTGASTLTGAVTAKSTLSVTGASTLAGPVSTGGNIYLAKNAAYFSKNNSGANTNILQLYDNDLHVGNGGYTGKFGTTFIDGNNVAFNVQTKNGAFQSKPYYSPGDTQSLFIYTAGFLSNGGKSVYFTIPLSKPLIGVSTVTVSSIDGLTVRQGTKYLYGASSSAYAKPSSYSVKNFNQNYVNIIAAMSNTTNLVSNNDSCGVQASIKLTFS